MNLRAHLLAGQVIPAHPLALTESRRLDERRQRALTRYYLAAGAGGIAVGVHTTQFAIRRPEYALLQPVLELASRTVDEICASSGRTVAKIAGVIGQTSQAVKEAELAHSLGYHAALLGLGAMADASDVDLIAHCRAIAGVLPVFGFYLQPLAGGRLLSYSFWREFAEIEQVVAIKIAPFNRYQTIDVVRAVADSGRRDIALYTGNDDNILLDLLTPFRFGTGEPLRIVGGLLGHWAVWTEHAVKLVEDICARRLAAGSPEALSLGIAITDLNAALFDAANGFSGCIPGIHEVLRRQGLVEGGWTLDPAEQLSQGQAEELDRVWRAYPELTNDDFVARHLDEWLR